MVKNQLKAENLMPSSEISASENKKPSTKTINLIRDSFTIPEADFALFAQIKQRALTASYEIKKSEILRAALNVLNSLPDSSLLNELKKVERIKMGRPKK